jgi:hypothetical protein
MHPTPSQLQCIKTGPRHHNSIHVEAEDSDSNAAGPVQFDHDGLELNDLFSIQRGSIAVNLIVSKAPETTHGEKKEQLNPIQNVAIDSIYYSSKAKCRVRA